MGGGRPGDEHEKNQHQRMAPADGCSDSRRNQQEDDTECAHHADGVQAGINIGKPKIA